MYKIKIVCIKNCKASNNTGKYRCYKDNIYYIDSSEFGEYHDCLDYHIYDISGSFIDAFYRENFELLSEWRNKRIKEVLGG